MMHLERLREAFWRDPYGFLTAIVMTLAAVGLVWIATPWFPYR